MANATTTAKTRTTTPRKPRTTKPKVEEPKDVAASQQSINSDTVLQPSIQVITYQLPDDPNQRQALVDSYWTLKQAGAPIHDSIRIPVEDWITNVQVKQLEEQQNAVQNAQDALNHRVANLNVTGPTYVRNLTNNPFHFRLDRQQGDGNNRPRRIELKPRGVPGDMHPIKSEDEQDPILITNLNLGLIELIPAGEAQIIIEKQTTNMSTRVHTPSQILQNEYKVLRQNGVDVADNPTIKIEAEYNSQGITVARIDQSVQDGRVDDKTLNRSGDKYLGGGLSRGDVQSQFIPTNGNPASISFDPLAVNRIQDDIARRKGLQGPAAGLGDVKVTVAPTERS
ncbi:unnamed protein product [Sphagnum balticum]